MTSKRHVLVVGGGITGLAAAWQASGDADTIVTLIEASPTVGGKLAVGDLDGIPIDLGAESLLNTRPEARDLADEVGLGSSIVHPATSAARLVAHGTLHPIPAGLVMGAPADADSVAAAGVLSAGSLAALRDGMASPVPPIAADTGIGAFVAAHVGDDAAHRLVDPILAGVYAGDAGRISMQAAAPSLFASAQHGGSFAEVVSRARRSPSGPVFAGLVGGVGTLPAAIATALRRRGATVLTSTAAVGVTTDGKGAWACTARTFEDEGAAGEPVELTATDLVLAVPAFAASSLLSTLPERRTPPAVFDAMRALDAIPYADVAVLSFAFPLDTMPAEATGSGLLIPSVEGRFIKAATFTSNKWEWSGDAAAAQGRFVLRASAGRFGESVEDLLDDQIIDRAHADLRDLLPGLPEPVAVRVDRWAQSLPQYLVGHLDRVARIRGAEAALPGLRLAGAGYDGIGIAACVASGRRAVGDVA